MILIKNIKHPHLLIIGIIFALSVSFPFCSRRISFEKLKIKNGEYYQGTDEQPFTGKAVEWYKNGRVKAEYSIEKGKFHGRTVTWYPDGIKKMEVDYQQGKKHGQSIGWYSTGTKEFSYRFKEGKREGKSILWYKNGQKKIETHYKEGKIHGELIAWYENGQKKEETQYQNDIEDGTKIQWYENGKKNSMDSSNKDFLTVLLPPGPKPGIKNLKSPSKMASPTENGRNGIETGNWKSGCNMKMTNMTAY